MLLGYIDAVTIYSFTIKRILDFIIALFAIILLFPLILLIAVMVLAVIGRPVLFRQRRPGRNGRLFTIYKFRTMLETRDEEGNLLPDPKRMNSFGKFLRMTSLDELPELWNIVKGEMAIVGPRPQLVKDMVFMSEEQKRRHSVRPGVTGLAQVNGRNAVPWDRKLQLDLEYISDITFIGDLKIVLKTVVTVFRHEGIEVDVWDEMDYGDWLLKRGAVGEKEYLEKVSVAMKILDMENGD